MRESRETNAIIVIDDASRRAGGRLLLLRSNCRHISVVPMLASYLVYLLAGAATVHALSPSLDVSQYAHTAWTTEDGSLKGGVRCIAQSPDGYLWLGTEFGLLRFDGVRFIPWNPPPGQHLPSSNIWSLVAARDGTLWIGTVEGLVRWKDGILTAYAELAKQNVLTLLEDREGTVWAGTFRVPKGKLCAIQREGVKCYGDDGSLGQWVWSLYEDRGGQVWVGAETGLWRCKPGPPKRYPLPHPIETPQAMLAGDERTGMLAIGERIWQLVDEKITDYRIPMPPGRVMPVNMFRDRDGGLWVGTLQRGLLHVYQGRTSVFAQNDGLSSDHVLTFFEDREGNVWVGTADGLDRFRDTSVFSVSEKQGLSSASVMSVLVARDNSVWLSTLDGLNRWHDGRVTIYWPASAGAKESARMPATQQTRSVSYAAGEKPAVTETTDPGLPDNTVGSLYEDQRGRIWVSTPKGIARFENGRFSVVKEVPGGWVNAITGDSNGGVWISDQDRGLEHWIEGKVVERVPWSRFGGNVVASSVIPDPLTGGLWLGFFQGGVVHFKDGQIRESYGQSEGLGNGRVMGLQLDNDGTLWAATEGGLSRIKGGRIVTLNSSNGLPCDTVHWAVTVDASLWMYTACGLLRVARSELESWTSNPTRSIQFTRLGRGDGVRIRALLGGYTPRVSQSADGRLWFADRQTVSVLDPRHLALNNTAPPVHIEQLTADAKSYNPRAGLRLPARVHDLTIDYTALSFAVPEKVRFRYKLEGQDPDWREVVNDREVQYSNLAPGTYTFRVLACNNSGVWNQQGDTLEFVIPPAWYQTNWFRALCAVIVLALVWAVYQLRVRQLRQQFKKLQDVIETIPAIVFEVAPDGSSAFGNRRWLEYTGSPLRQYGKFAPKDQAWRDSTCIHPEDLDAYVKLWERAFATGQPFELETRVRGANGGYRWFLARHVALRDKHGKILKWFGTLTDIEDRKRGEQERERLHQLEADLAHINRVSMMGELTASIAHEVNQPLAGVVSNGGACVRWLAGDPPNLEEAREAARRIVRDGKRAGEVIARIRALTKKTSTPREKLDLNETLRQVLALVGDEAKRKSVNIRTQFADDLFPVSGDQVQLQQVVLNLAMNAIEAMSSIGERPRELVIGTKNIDADQVQVTVEDSGIGIDPLMLDKIFDSFYTTKPGGMGMGLSISRSILQAHGGRLWATAKDGKGTIFYFTLPKHQEEANAGVAGN
jgi:PAS domain S-box-containing protein